MEWTDKAILLKVAKTGTKALALEVFARNHGRCQCHSEIDKKKIPILLPGSFLSMDYVSAGAGTPGSAVLQDVDGGVIAASTKDASLVVLTCVKDLLCALMHIGDPAPELYDRLEALMNSLIAEDGRWPVHYALWEFTLIRTLGHIQGMGDCRAAFRHGDTIYLSPSSGKIYPRERVGAFLDRMLPLPGFLMGARNANAVEVRQALQLNAVLFECFVFPDSGGTQTPPVRKDLLDIARQVQAIPPAPSDGAPTVDLEARRKRLLSLRPLMVSVNTQAS